MFVQGRLQDSSGKSPAHLASTIAPVCPMSRATPILRGLHE